MRVLVTGHRGYIGTVLTPMLMARGHAVTGLDSDLYERCGFAPGGAMPAVPTIRKDIREVVPGELLGFDAVLHLAALSNDPLGNFRPETTRSINFEGTMQVARAAKPAGVGRFVFSSTCSNYGASGSDFIDEGASFNPVTPYGDSKVAAERALAGMVSDGFCVTNLRSATAYGVGPRIRFDLVLNNLVAWAVTTGRIHMNSDGTPWRPIVHIEDIARAFVAVMEAPEESVQGQAFNVGVTAHNYQIRELAQIVADVVPGCEISFAEDAGPDKRSYRVDCEKNRRVLPGFEPRWDPRRGAEEIRRACLEAGLTLAEFEGPRYQRIGHIRQLIGMGIIDETLTHAAAVRAGWAGDAPDPAFAADAAAASCVSCGHEGLRPILDLGPMPRSDGLIEASRLVERKSLVPLRLGYCPGCSLVQLLETRPPEEMFGADYLYFSSVSDDLLSHARRHAEALIGGRGLGPDSHVVEIASNDGYMLRNFLAAGIPVLGIDPAPEPARAARAKGIETLEAFFGLSLARRLRGQGRCADVIIASTVVAHVADQNDLVAGMAELLADDGQLVVEFPHVRDLIDHGEFDTVYHEHLCYFSAGSARALFARHGLHLNDVTRLAIHGGSLRLTFGRRPAPSDAVAEILAEERALGIDRFDYYAGFGAKMRGFRERARRLLGDLRAEGKRIAAYGAAAKGTILLNYLGLDARVIEFAVDRNPHKQGRYMPGVRVPVVGPGRIAEARPDLMLILPWNFRDEIIRQQRSFLEGGGRFLVPIPDLQIVGA